MANNVKITISAVDKASKEFKSVENTATSSFGKITKAAGAASLALAGVGTALSVIAKQTIDYGDKLHKLNLRLGVNVTQLDKLRQIADLSGVTFETLTMGLQRMTRRVAEASNGTGEAVNALKELNLSAEHLNQISPDEQFRVISRELMNVNNSGTRAALAMKLFDSEGVALIQMMAGLEDKMKKTNSAMSKDAVASMAAYKDNMTKLSENVKQTFLPILSDIVKGINEVIDVMNTSPKDDIGFIERMFYGPGGKAGWEKKVREGGFAKDDIPSQPTSDAYGANKAKDFVKDSNAWARQMNGLEKWYLNQDKKDSTPKSIDTTGFDDINTETADWWERERKSMLQYDIWYYQNLNNQMEKSREYAQKLRDTIAIHEGNEMGSSDMFMGIEAANQRAQEAMQETTEKGLTLSEMFKYDFAGNISSALTDMITGAKDAKSAFAALATQIAQAIIQKQIMNAISGAKEGGGIVGFLGALFGGGSAKGNIFQNGEVTAFAAGGIVNKPTLFPMANGMGLMGEAGPEAVMPLKRGKGGKLGVEASGAMGGSITVVNNVSVQNQGSGDQRQSRKLGNEISAAIETKMNEWAAKNMRAGGLFNKSYGRTQ